MIAISTPEIAHRFLVSDWEDISHRESVVVVYLDRYNFVLSKEVLFTGGRNEVTLDPYVVFEHAFRHRASNFLVVHNHPNNNLQPSEEDQEMSERIKLIADIFDIKTAHMIVTQRNYHVISFFD